MMAQRTRSLNELPGHLRVPILRRKDTGRTKERLAAGLAGMEELKSLRQQQQQLVGETVTKAEDRHHDRRQWEKPLHSSSSLTQTTNSPRRPHSFSWASFRGYSMDSISEEGDGGTNNGRVDLGSNSDHWDINNNYNKDTRDSPDLNIISQSQMSLDEFKSGSPDSHQPRPCNPHPVSDCQNPILYQRFDNGNETLPTQRPEENKLYCSVMRNRHPITPQQNQCQILATDKVTETDTPSRRHSMSEWYCGDTVSWPHRQRSMSVDMGQHGTRSFQSPRQSPLSKKDQSLRVSSMSCININSNDTRHGSIHGDSSSLNTSIGSRLSESTPQIMNDLVCSRLRRRGSLTWDSLLESIGIHNSTSLTSLDKTGERESVNNTQSSDDVFDLEKTRCEEELNVSINRKKGRSMSFSCNASSSMIDSQNDHADIAQQIQSAEYSRNIQCIGKHSLEDESSLPQSIHPILRRASFQCEAVLTNSNRVVNPLHDVDVTSFRSPGPLHAVMLQYQGYNSPHARQCTNLKDDSSNPACSDNAQKVSHAHLSERNKIKAPSLCSLNDSVNAHHNLTECINESASKPVSTRIQGRVLENDVQVDTNSMSGSNAMREKTSSLTGCCETKESQSNNTQNTSFPFISTEQQKSLNEDVMPILLQDTQKSLISPFENMEDLEPVHDVHVPDVYPRSNASETGSALHQHPLDTNTGGPCYSQVDNALVGNDTDFSCLISQKITEEHENVSQLSNYRKAFKSHYENKPAKDNVNLTEENNSGTTAMKARQTAQNDFYVKEKTSYSHCESPKPDNSLKLGISNRLENKEKFALLNTNENSDDVPYIALRRDNKNKSRLTSSPPSETHQTAVIENIDERHDCHGKRSSIFSDVSLMSDSSGKTPSSTASVFSDVSIMSDEGYITWDSVSPDNKFVTFSSQICSVSRPNSVAFSDNLPCYGKDSENSMNNPPCRTPTTGVNIDKNGNGTALKYFQNDCDKHQKNFHYEKEISLEHSTQVVFNRDEQIQKTNAKINRCRKLIKQTTV